MEYISKLDIDKPINQEVQGKQTSIEFLLSGGLEEEKEPHLKTIK